MCVRVCWKMCFGNRVLVIGKYTEFDIYRELDSSSGLSQGGDGGGVKGVTFLAQFILWRGSCTWVKNVSGSTNTTCSSGLARSILKRTSSMRGCRYIGT